VRGFGAALVVAGVALPWVVAASGGWAAAEPVLPLVPVVPPGRAPEAEPAPASAPALDAGPASGTQVAEATVMRPALVHVAGGTFMMGSPPAEVGRYENETQHRVQVSSFVMCETEVTQAQFVAVAGKLPGDCGASCGDALPAHSVSWLDAADYLDALSRKEGLRPCYSGREGETVSWDRSCDGYRLPTEAEWEYAARAGTTTAYSFGDSPAELCKHANGGEQESCDDGFAGLAPVGSFRANRGNAWNLLDMHGNVWEWVWDGYDAGFGLDVSHFTDVNQLTIDPGGPDPFVGDWVLRGGSFDLVPRHLRSANRDRREPSFRSGYIGFRCVRAARPQP
jgi:sulfatase modifying factor 1